jgi:catechol 2,3-dioxygenase-like lactoylglutathione lyase family enzyme
MKFSGSLISVKDINVSRKFYEDLFGLKVRFDFGINIGFDCGLSLQQDFDWLVGLNKEEIKYKTNNFELYFETEDLEGFIDRFKNYPDITFLHDVKSYDWGQRVVRFYDLDWHIIEVGESMVSVVRRFLKQGLSIEETADRSQHSIEFVKSCIE